MGYYDDVYKKRLNRYGIDYRSRLQGQREKVFDGLLLKSPNRVDFEYNGNSIPGIFERHKQDEMNTLGYLLTRMEDRIDPGTIVILPKRVCPFCETEFTPWMIYWLEEIQSTGYNRYIILRMNQEIEWTDENGYHKYWVSLRGRGDTVLTDTLESFKSSVLYNEDNNYNFLIMPKNPYIKKDLYFNIGKNEYRQGYRVVGYDYNSTPGIEYVTLNPIYIYDETPAPTPAPDDEKDDFYWFGGEE